MATPAKQSTHDGPVTTEDKILETGASLCQSTKPIQNICAHLNAFHTPFDAPGSRAVETNHYCAHITLPASSDPATGSGSGESSIRQCVLYDSPEPDARLIGVEYMIPPHLFSTLPATEKPLWHTHVFEVRSGMLVMPTPLTSTPGARQAWEAAETAEMAHVVKLYGKVFHTWQTDLGHGVPLGMPRLMTSFTGEEQFGGVEGGFEGVVGGRDARLGTDWRRGREIRAGIKGEEVDERADGAWKRRGSV